MDQNVRTTDSPTFNNLTLTGTTQTFTNTSQFLFDHTGNSGNIPFEMRKAGSTFSDSGDYGTLTLTRTNHNNSATSVGSNIHFNLKDSGGTLREYAGLGGRKTEAGAAGGALYFYRYGRTELGYWNANGLYASTFYDRDNTAFYLDPNGYSNVSQLNAAEFFVDGLKVLNSVGSNTATGTINAIWGMLKPTGYKLYPDEEFQDGSNSIQVYNNAGGSAVTITRKNGSFIDGTAANMPNRSGFVLEIQHAPTTSNGTNPGYGGWYFAAGTGPSSRRLLCVFKMKIPVGRSVEWASNPIGTNGTGEWLTSNAGTGQYQDYAYLVHSGTASFSSTHFFYIVGGSTATFYTYLASSFPHTHPHRV
jgi:hypothetical protein